MCILDLATDVLGRDLTDSYPTYDGQDGIGVVRFNCATKTARLVNENIFDMSQKFAALTVRNTIRNGTLPARNSIIPAMYTEIPIFASD